MEKILEDKLRILESEQLRLHDLLLRQRRSGRHCCFYCDSNDLAFDGGFADEDSRHVVVSCAECGLSQLDTHQQTAAAKVVDDSTYEPVSKEQVEEAVSAHDFIRVMLERITEKPGRVLEVECGDGYRLEVARRAGWEIQGLETSARSCRFAHEVLGVPVFEGTPERFMPDAAFDAVIAWHVLERAPSLHSLLDHLRIFMAAGAHLFVQVPSYRQYRPLRPWEDYTENFNSVHYWHFDQDTLSALVGRHGFEAIEVVDDPHMRMLTVIARKVDGGPS